MVLAIKGDYFLSHIWHTRFHTFFVHRGIPRSCHHSYSSCWRTDERDNHNFTTSVLQKRQTINLFVFCFLTPQRSGDTCVDYLNQELDAVDQSLLELEQILKDSDKDCMDLNTTKNAMDLYKVSSRPQQQVLL